MQPLVYMSLHIFLTMATFAVSKIWWSSYGAHTAFLLSCLVVSAWNGASYYFDVFAHRYVAGLDTLLQAWPSQPGLLVAASQRFTTGCNNLL